MWCLPILGILHWELLITLSHSERWPPRKESTSARPAFPNIHPWTAWDPAMFLGLGSLRYHYVLSANITLFLGSFDWLGLPALKIIILGWYSRNLLLSKQWIWHVTIKAHDLVFIIKYMIHFSMSQKLIWLYIFKDFISLRVVLSSQQNSKESTDFPIYSLPSHMHILSHHQHPPTDWYISYNWETYIDTS